MMSALWNNFHATHAECGIGVILLEQTMNILGMLSGKQMQIVWNKICLCQICYNRLQFHYWSFCSRLNTPLTFIDLLLYAISFFK